ATCWARSVGRVWACRARATSSKATAARSGRRVGLAAGRRSWSVCRYLILDAFKSMCLYKHVLDGAILNALADPRRRAILRLVRDVERPAGDIAAHFPEVTGPAISQHLRVLREAGLLAERRAGTRRLYRVRPEGLHELREWLREF